MPATLADALGAFRKFNYDNIYMRAESRAQAKAVIDLLRALVEHYTQHPHLIRDAVGIQSADHDAVIHDAVAYVGGMTDRFACRQAIALLNWDHSRLPQGIDTH